MSFTFREFLTEEEKISRNQLNFAEKTIDSLFHSIGVDVTFKRHFFERLNDARNKKQITLHELIAMFNETFKKYGKKIAKLTPDIEGVISDISTDLNSPIAINIKNGMVELVAKTIMRKKRFKSSRPKDVKFVVKTS